MSLNYVRGSMGPDSDVVVSVEEGKVVRWEDSIQWCLRTEESLPPHLGVLQSGLVDIHCHGGGGYSFITTDEFEARKAADFHHRHGSTTVIASLVTAPESVLLAQIRTLVPLVREGVIGGIHLEGPFLARSRCGAQNPDHMVLPNARMTERFLHAGDGCIVMMTLAPELPGFYATGAVLEDAGVAVALGHSDADGVTFRSALDAEKPRVITHCGNAMPGLHHRNPGPLAEVITALAQGVDVKVELIADGHHIADDFFRMVWAVSGGRGIVLVSDAMAAAGMPDGEYNLGDQYVRVNNGQARLKNGALAGSTSTLSCIVERVQHVGGSLRDCIIRSASEVLEDPLVGGITPGSWADIVVMTPQGKACGVMRRGAWL